MLYYNDFDAGSCAWLGELIREGHLPAGKIDNRSIVDVQPDDLAGFKQCHFFAGIGGWPLALRLAGWPDDREVWTGSAPCQPFSVAGRGRGYEDERHLAPTWLELIRQCRPATLFGEQVASAAGRDWLADLRTELEAMGYAVGAADLCAASVGAPHIRQRLFFGAVRLADTDRGERYRVTDGQGCESDRKATRRQQSDGEPERGGANSGLADADGARQLPGTQTGIHRSEEGAGPRYVEPERHGDVGGLANTERNGQYRGGDVGTTGRTEPANGGATPVDWRDADWLGCRDGKFRPVEPGTFPLAHGVSGRVGLLRGYGNAIVPQVAAEFIKAFSEAAGIRPVRLTPSEELFG